MNEKTEIVLVAAVLVIAIIMLPISAAILTHGTDPYRIIEGDPVQTAAEQAGLVICSETPVTWNMPGAEGGKTYLISDNCENPSETVRVEVQKFNSAESRDAAIMIFHSRTLGKAKSPGNLLIIGQYLVFVDSSGSSLFEKIFKKFEGI